MGSDRIVVTHAGSLVRPPDLIPFLRAIDGGEPYDEAAHARCLSDSVRDVVARQREAGVDVELPAGKTIVPGVISHATNVVEHPELVAERLSRFASLVGPENVAAGTDCGFAQGPYIQRVHPSIMWAKLAALAEGAALATEREFA